MTGWIRSCGATAASRSTRFRSGPGTAGAADHVFQDHAHRCRWPCVGMIGIVTDLTELKGAVQKAREALVGKTVAEEASQAKSLFLANMSHEIRTPADRHHRFFGGLARRQPEHVRAHRGHPDHQPDRPAPARHHQRHTRPVQDRGRPAGSRAPAGFPVRLLGEVATLGRNQPRPGASTSISNRSSPCPRRCGATRCGRSRSCST